MPFQCTICLAVLNIFSSYFRDSLGFHLEGNIIFSSLDFELICYRKGWAAKHVVAVYCVARGTQGNSKSDPGGVCKQKDPSKGAQFCTVLSRSG